MNEETVPEYDRIIAHDKDIADSRRISQWSGSEVASSISDDLVKESEHFLEQHEVEPGERLDVLLQELDTAIAINNDPHARELRRALSTRFRKEWVG